MAIRSSGRASRSPDTAKLDVPAVRLDFADFPTIPAALEDVERLFILTDYTVDMLRQSKALNDHARKCGVQQIVDLGACGSDDTDVAHYGWHQFIECYIAACGIGYTHLRPEKHGPLFSSQPEVRQHVRKYTQAHTGPLTPDGFAVAPFDGIAEIWFDDMAGFLGVFASKTYENVIKPDEMNFVDRSKALFMFLNTFPMIE